MPTPIAKMGRIAKQEMTLHLGDLIHDGEQIALHGEERYFLWLVRETGTDIFVIDSPNNYLADAARTYVERTKRFFIMKNMDSSTNGIFVEIDKDRGYQMLKDLHTDKLGFSERIHEIQSIIRFYSKPISVSNKSWNP